MDRRRRAAFAASVSFARFFCGMTETEDMVAHKRGEKTEVYLKQEFTTWYLLSRDIGTQEKYSYYLTLKKDSGKDRILENN